MKKKAMYFLVLALAVIAPMQSDAKATDSGTTWGIIGTTLGATSLGLQVYDRVNNRQALANNCRTRNCNYRNNRPHRRVRHTHAVPCSYQRDYSRQQPAYSHVQNIQYITNNY